MSPARVRCVLIAVGALLAVAGLPAPAGAFSSTNKAKILYVGDSLAVNTGNVVAWWTQVSGKATTQVDAFPGMALCDYLDGKPAGMSPASKLPEEVASFKPDLVILQLGVVSRDPSLEAAQTNVSNRSRSFSEARDAVTDSLVLPETTANGIDPCRASICSKTSGTTVSCGSNSR